MRVPVNTGRRMFWLHTPHSGVIWARGQRIDPVPTGTSGTEFTCEPRAVEPANDRIFSPRVWSTFRLSW